MSVLLVGVGADGDHVMPELQLDQQGRFEYIPIPDTEEDTASLTYGDWELDYQDGTATNRVKKICPYGDGNWITDQETIAEYPVHHDPNFEALTFADKKSDGGKGSQIKSKLKSGDVLGFYTGIKRGPDDSDLQRYLYGYMTVNDIHDLSDLNNGGYHDRLREFPENAHTKRLIGAGEPKHEDIVIVDGCEPAEKLTYPIRMSERIDEPPWYKITDEFASRFAVQNGLKGICRKFPVELQLAQSEFIERVDYIRQQG
ncbi:Nmad3 family putative nucleotide modification protein [Natranaeroarchaeum sulfidigenes]|uniref:Nucleotide modification associated domain-containing protein n=1 Tax=Natranaeroarchaeum sulfidigenes TaxID=2784880 RepID=A0A897MQI3_9EURY|nr:hypothetical protein [Natranaeroarchaeum sulfidigenes]QSG02797.1 Uncharacterized protein AArcS_1586 [Natranaeroarchaeum sulfidigenes]